eukprot:2507004-Amphidinium_carterae.1
MQSRVPKDCWKTSWARSMLQQRCAHLAVGRVVHIVSYAIVRPKAKLGLNSLTVRQDLSQYSPNLSENIMAQGIITQGDAAKGVSLDSLIDYLETEIKEKDLRRRAELARISAYTINLLQHGWYDWISSEAVLLSSKYGVDMKFAVPTRAAAKERRGVPLEEVVCGYGMSGMPALDAYIAALVGALRDFPYHKLNGGQDKKGPDESFCRNCISQRN